jgi:hypothetical protein
MPYHDLHNYRGRIVRDRLGNAFWTHGDTGLHWKFKGKIMLLYAATSSIYDVLLATLSGVRRPELEQNASDRLPIAYLELDDKSLEELDALGRSGGTRTLGDGRWIPLNAMHDPAHVEGAPGIEYRHAIALTEKDYERDQLTLVVSSQFDRAYGYRYDLGAGVGTSPLRGDGAISVHQRAGLTLPIYAQYSSLLGYDLGVGGIAEECIAACRATDDGIDRRGLAQGYLALRVNVEAGKLVLLQAFVEGLLGSDFGGTFVGGVGFGIVLGKPVRTAEPAQYSGPPI